MLHLCAISPCAKLTMRADCIAMKTPMLSLVAVLTVAPVGACQKDNADAQKQLRELSERVEKLEKGQRDFDEISEFLQPIMAQQKAQRAQQEASEPDPNARFAVDITGNQMIGPAGAAVTIIEAWDFA